MGGHGGSAAWEVLACCEGQQLAAAARTGRGAGARRHTGFWLGLTCRLTVDGGCASVTDVRRVARAARAMRGVMMPPCRNACGATADDIESM